MHLFDDRSSLSSRLTGWERYSRELALRLDTQSDFAPIGLSVEGLRQRLQSDWLGLPKVLSRSASGVLMPTFPPTPRLDMSRVVWVLHDLTWARYPQWASRMGRYYYRPLARIALAEVAHIVTVSETIRSELISGGTSPSRVSRVYPGSSSVVPTAESCRPKAAIADNFILAVGSLEPRKNLDLLYRTWSHTDVRSAYTLVVAGRTAWGGEPPTWVTHIDSPSDSELAWLYRNCAALVQPSLYEGFGLPIIEAAGYGASIACSDIAVFREIAPAGSEFFDPYDEYSCASAIRRAVTKRGAPQEDVRSFDWSESAREITKLCDKWLP